MRRKGTIVMTSRDDSADITIFSQPPPPPPSVPHRASLIVLAGGEIGRCIEMTEDELIIGRSILSTSRITAPSVSRQHASIRCVEKDGERQYEISDLASRNGTRVNNVPIQSARLQHGDKVHLGEVAFKFVVQDHDEVEFHEKVHELIHYDRLTGLLTMDTFWRRLEEEMTSSHGACFSLAMTDLDGLKRVNDTYGHLAGRMVVREMGAIIRSVLRLQDHGGLYGGDEAILLFGRSPLSEAMELAEKLRVAIADHEFEHQGKTFRVSISQGLAEWPTHGTAANELVAAADAALYAAKESGRNCVRCAGA